MGQDTRGYRELIAWQKAMDLVPMTYQLLRKLPREETYALADQIRRAVVSVPANIAEGQARKHHKEFQQHLSIARGSLAEVDTLLLAGQRLGYWKESELSEAMNLVVEVRCIIQGLIQSPQSVEDAQTGDDNRIPVLPLLLSPYSYSLLPTLSPLRTPGFGSGFSPVGAINSLDSIFLVGGGTGCSGRWIILGRTRRPAAEPSKRTGSRKKAGWLQGGHAEVRPRDPARCRRASFWWASLHSAHPTVSLCSSNY